MSVVSLANVVTVGELFGMLAELGVGQPEVQATIDDPIRRAVVAAAYRNKIEAVSIAPACWIAREMAISAELVKYGLPAFGAYDVEYMSTCASVHDRFIPDDLTLQVLFPFFYSWNNTGGNEQIKLAHVPGNEWWRTDKNAESLPTKAGVLTCDFDKVMQAVDLSDRPFFLSMDEQVKFAKQMGGSGLTSVEQLTYLFIRSVVERRLPLWSAGLARCCNLYGSGYLLSVDWSADHGFCINHRHRTAKSWRLGAVLEAFTALKR